jgi:hypothetical protein
MQNTDPYDDDEYHQTIIPCRPSPNLNDLISNRPAKRPHSDNGPLPVKKAKLFRTDKLSLVQIPSFITKPDHLLPDGWIGMKSIVERRSEILNIHKFSIKSLNEKVLEAKVKVAGLEREKSAVGRRLANPFDKVKNSVFINR